MKLRVHFYFEVGNKTPVGLLDVFSGSSKEKESKHTRTTNKKRALVEETRFFFYLLSCSRAARTPPPPSAVAIRKFLFTRRRSTGRLCAAEVSTI